MYWIWYNHFTCDRYIFLKTIHFESQAVILVPSLCRSSFRPGDVRRWKLPAFYSVHQVSKVEGLTPSRGCSVTGEEWFWPWHVPVVCCTRTGWLWHWIGFFWFLGRSEGVVDETELSCVAGLLSPFGAMRFLTLSSLSVASCVGQAFRGDEMGATCTHVSLGSELWAALYIDRASDSSLLQSFPFACLLHTTSGKYWFASHARSGEEGEWSLSSRRCFNLLSCAPTRGHLVGTGDGVGESVPVQLSLRF